MSLYDAFFQAYRRITGAPVQRERVRFPGAVVTDDPAAGETVVTFAGGNPVASVSGTAPITSTGGANPTIAFGLWAENASPAIGQTQATTATDGATLPITGQAAKSGGAGHGGDVTINGGAKDGAGYGGGVNLGVGGTIVAAIKRWAGTLGGGGIDQGVAYVGNAGDFALMVANKACVGFALLFEPTTTGSGSDILILGQDSGGGNGNGGGFTFATGAKNGSGNPGSFKVKLGGAGGTDVIKGTGSSKLLTLGAAGLSAVALQLNGLTTTTVGAIGAADPLPALPVKYLHFKDETGAELVLACYNPP